MHGQQNVKYLLLSFNSNTQRNVLYKKRKKKKDLYSSSKIIRMIQNQGECDRRIMWHVLGGTELHTRFWWGNLMEIDYLEDLSADGRIIFKWIFKK